MVSWQAPSSSPHPSPQTWHTYSSGFLSRQDSPVLVCWLQHPSPDYDSIGSPIRAGDPFLSAPSLSLGLIIVSHSFTCMVVKEKENPKPCIWTYPSLLTLTLASLPPVYPPHSSTEHLTFHRIFLCSIFCAIMKEMKANGVHFGWTLPSPPTCFPPTSLSTSQKGNTDAKRLKVFSN